MNQIKFTIPGDPKGKGRPRYTKAGHAYTPADTVNYEAYVVNEYFRQTGNHWFGNIESLRMDIKAFYSIPKSTSKRKMKKMLAGDIRPTKKPDLDNLAKIIADSLNGIAYRDDAQIVDMRIKKFYSDYPRVEVGLSQVESKSDAKLLSGDAS